MVGCSGVTLPLRNLPRRAPVACMRGDGELSARELRRELASRGISAAGVFEREELQRLLDASAGAADQSGGREARPRNE